MGCDIHCVWQKRASEGWEDVPSVYPEDRNYELFGILAGVRGDEVPISPPRGLPTDFAVTDEEDAWEHPVATVELLGWMGRYHRDNEPLVVWMGDHSRSWLSGAEMLEWWRGHETGDWYPDIRAFFAEGQRLVTEHGEIRLVFGFDN